MTDATVTLIVMGVAIVAFISNRLPVGVVAILTALSLYGLGVLDLGSAVAGFGDPAVLFLASLFVVAEGLDASGITSWIARSITARVHGETALMVALMVVTAVLAALLTPNGAAAAMVPIVLTSARSIGVSPAKMLMPVAFAASAGALLTLSGSVVNVLVSQTAQEATGQGFGYFEFGIAGVLLVGGSILAVVTVQRWIPVERDTKQTKDFGRHVDALVEHYELEQGFYRLRVDEESGVSAQGLGSRAELYAVQTPDGGVRGLDEDLHTGDELLVTGQDEDIEELVRSANLSIVQTPLRRSTQSQLVLEEAGAAEVIVAPRSALAGRSVFTGMRIGTVTILGIRHKGKDARTAEVELQEGDTLLVHGPRDGIFRLVDFQEVVLVDCPESMRRQLAPLGRRAWVAGAITLVMIVALSGNLLEPAVAGLLAACAMVLFKVVSAEQAYRAISWQMLVLIGALIALSTAITSSGAAELLADRVLSVAGGGGVVPVLAVVFLVTAALGQFVSNTASVLVMTPVVLAIGEASTIDPRMMLMSLAIASGASFLTPIATPANMIAGAASGYHFSDYWRPGLALMAVWFIVAVFFVPIVW